jgi:hypothetical protein
MIISFILLSLLSNAPVLANSATHPSFTVSPAPSAQIAGCPLLPADNIWNARVDTLPVDAHSDAYIHSTDIDRGLHPDFGSGLWDGNPIGIPYNLVTGSQTPVSVSFDYADESDPGPYPIPGNPSIEGGSDRHILIVDRDHCMLYELYAAERLSNGDWTAGSGAIFDLRSNALRPTGWTSADAAGLPILPGLARYEEVASGQITHALRFTLAKTRAAYIWPARHLASSRQESNFPPMGQRFRLKASFDISRFSPQVKVILQALKTYGMILADNGSDWYISGAPDPAWDNDRLVNELKQMKGTDFEAVNVSSLMASRDSGRVFMPGEMKQIYIPLVKGN